MTMKEQVLKAMKEVGKPVSAGDITKILNADRKEVDKAFAELKKDGAIVSPVRCKWAPAGRNSVAAKLPKTYSGCEINHIQTSFARVE